MPQSGLNPTLSARARSGSNWENIAMRHPRLPATRFASAALLIAGVLAPLPALPQAQPPARGQAHPPAPIVGPYKQVPIKLAPAMNDPSFAAFRKQLGQIAEKKDRAALASLVAQNFFWLPEDKDVAEKGKPGIDNLAKALSLDDAGGFGWEALAGYATEPTAAADAQRPGVFCAPADPSFDDKAADQLTNATHTDPADWAFPVRDGIEVRAAAKPDAPVVDKLGLYLVHVLADEASNNPAFLKVVTPSGKVGYAPAESVLPIGGEQLCYIKQGGGWKIAGFYGGEANQ
jgi:hypothetical protein